MTYYHKNMVLMRQMFQKQFLFDVPSLLTPQDKFDVLIYMYQKDYGYEALTELIKKYDLARLKYTSGESKPSYVITPEEINEIYEKENYNLTFDDKLKCYSTKNLSKI